MCLKTNPFPVALGLSTKHLQHQGTGKYQSDLLGCSASFQASAFQYTDNYYIQLAVLLTLMVGLLECIMGILRYIYRRLGWILRDLLAMQLYQDLHCISCDNYFSQAKYTHGNTWHVIYSVLITLSCELTLALLYN